MATGRYIGIRPSSQNSRRSALRFAIAIVVPVRDKGVDPISESEFLSNPFDNLPKVILLYLSFPALSHSPPLEPELLHQSVDWSRYAIAK